MKYKNISNEHLSISTASADPMYPTIVTLDLFI